MSQKSKSFTLIETLVAISIFALVMGAVSGMVIMLYRIYGYSWEQSVAINEARRGIETMVKEIRTARAGEDGSFPIVLAGDKEFIFFSDIDNDGQTERVRYFLGVVGSGSQTQECSTSVKGGTCSVLFSNFLQGVLKSAEVKVSVDGDFGSSREYADIYADGINLGRICQTGCTDCPRAWQGTTLFNVVPQANDNSLTLLADASSDVDPSCPHSMKAKFEFSWTEDLSGLVHEFKKGVIEPVGSPATYPLDQEKVTVLSSFVRNTPPIFEYFDSNGNKIEDYPARLADTKLMKVYLVVNVNLNRPPNDFELESWVQLRNLKSE